MAMDEVEVTGAANAPTASRPGGKVAYPAGWRWPVVAGAALVAFVAVAVAVMAGSWLGGWDMAVLAEVVATRRAVLTPAAQLMTWLGSGPVLVVVGLTSAGVVGLRSRRSLLPVALLATFATSAGLVTLLKIIVGRPRPPADLVIGVPAGSDAFPSGHTTNGSVVYLLAALLLALTVTRPAVRRVLLSTGLVLALSIGWSRLYLGFHWFSDVIAGWLLAAASVSTAMTVIGRWSLPAEVARIDAPGRRSSLPRDHDRNRSGGTLATLTRLS